ncbi:CRISPR-associated endonuclease Cas1 [Listeria monocytogenes]|uniref:CRISPR-associated endonuclease Cas1 n=1 Tax=Listeria monocytogenes TaxID=1639 RepID=UPI003B437230
MLNKHIITEDDFEKDANFCYMKKAARQKVLQAYDLRMKETIKHDRKLLRHILNYKFNIYNIKTKHLKFW